jgi:hypothetical protein
MQEVSPQFGGSIAKKEFASHPLTRSRAECHPLRVSIQFPDSLNKVVPPPAEVLSQRRISRATGELTTTCSAAKIFKSSNALRRSNRC